MIEARMSKVAHPAAGSRGWRKGAFAEVSWVPPEHPVAGPSDKIRRTVALRGAECCRGFIHPALRWYEVMTLSWLFLLPKRRYQHKTGVKNQ